MTDCIVPPLKRCSKCKQEFPATLEYFHAKKHGKYGLDAPCKSCERIYMKAYRSRPEHNQRRRELRKRPDDKVKRREYQRQPDVKARARTRTKTRRENPAVLAAELAYRQTAGYKNRMIKHRQNPQVKEYMNTYQAVRKARKRSLPAEFTLGDWLRALDYFNGCCAVCGRPAGLWHTLAQDHWIPLAKGGGTVASNIVPLCHGDGGCNNSKWSNLPDDWLIRRYGNKRAKQIIARIQTYFNSLD